MFRKTIVLLNLRSNILQQRHNSTDVGFIGIGNMGTRMATNMINKGLKLKVYDIDSAAARSVKGATVVNSPKEAAQDVKVVITMLPDSSVVRESVRGKDGIVEGNFTNSLKKMATDS
ncbi:NAD binding domain of 6-phosphogluconate dehydrogenase [Popillia japonica]|uniref:3-hydroxyisobutyrate dehydrogenase n=1 Tax=Popillia japonica TaxID=7064 RepID=A0AAW1IZZ2_POPJA